MKHLNQYSLFPDLTGSNAGANELTKEQTASANGNGPCLMVRVSASLYALSNPGEQSDEIENTYSNSYTSNWEKINNPEQ